MCFLWWGKRVRKSPVSLSSIFLFCLCFFLSLLSYHRFRILHRLHRMYIFISFLDPCDHHHHFPFPDPLKNNLRTSSNESSVSLRIRMKYPFSFRLLLSSLESRVSSTTWPFHYSSVPPFSHSQFVVHCFSTISVSTPFPNSTWCTFQFFDHILTQHVGEEFEKCWKNFLISFGRPKFDPFLWRRRIKYRWLCVWISSTNHSLIPWSCQTVYPVKKIVLSCFHTSPFSSNILSSIFISSILLRSFEVLN